MHYPLSVLLAFYLSFIIRLRINLYIYIDEYIPCIVYLVFANYIYIPMNICDENIYINII